MKLVSSEKLKYENNRDYIYRVLKDSIIKCYLEPGQIISETQLHQYFDVSRSPLREAISVLANERLINVTPQKHTRIVNIDADCIIQSNIIRALCEQEAFSLICNKENNDDLVEDLEALLAEAERISIDSRDDGWIYKSDIDNRFHAKIFEYVGYRVMWELLRDSNVQYNRFLYLYIDLRESEVNFINDHREIIENIKHKDFDKLVKRKAKSNLLVASYLNKLKQLKPEYFEKHK
ncbi:MAG: GntR family transcriptional regulator [Erysipelotrichaceae bacterium]|nr:GntR family transcriptional regulator [Erysipelotrichaceae bacterium]